MGLTLILSWRSLISFRRFRIVNMVMWTTTKFVAHAASALAFSILVCIVAGASPEWFCAALLLCFFYTVHVS